jgi:RHS repeat-associated protein
MRSLYRRVAASHVVAIIFTAGTASAQYCPIGTNFDSQNYFTGQCTVGSCWSKSPFAGSTPVTGNYPGNNYACAASAAPAGAQEVTVYTYDGNGNPVMVKDPLSHLTTSAYDSLNRLIQVTNPLHEVTSLGYEASGGLTQVTDPRTLITSYTLDGFGQATGVASPDTGTTTSTYDGAGNLLTQTDARGVTATYTYDDINRVKSVTYSRSGSADEIHLFGYDAGANAKGRLTSLADTAASTSWAYEAHGRVLSKTQTVGAVTRIVTYGYNAAGQLQTLTTPSGQQIGYTYLNNRVSGITVNGAPVIVSATTEPFGPLSVWHWANNHYSYRDYDLDGRVATWEFRNGVSVIRNDLTFDNASRVTQISDPANSSLLGTYQYDDGDKLNVAQRGSPVASTIQYGYDSVGNRKTTTLDAGSITAVYGTTNNHLESMSGSLPAGYMLGASNVVFTYNNANRLVGIQADGANVASYLVNGLGQRVQKSAGGSVTIFVYDEAGHLLGEYDGTGALIQETVWMEDMPVATLRPSGGGVTVYYVHPDHLGTPRAITRPSDNVFMWRWDNTEAFGNSQPNENPAGQGTFKYGLRFPGQYYDAEIGTNYNYFRDYDPSTGRYVESDPIGLRGGINTYAYVGSSPIQYRDPNGLFLAPAPAALSLGAAGAGAVVAGGIGVAIGLGINAATEHFSGDSIGGHIYDWAHPSDPALQEAIEREANRREYKARCNEPPPPNLDPCERARWELQRAKDCKALRQANTDRWWGGVDDRHNAQLAADLDRAIRNAEERVKRLCTCPQQ